MQEGYEYVEAYVQLHYNNILIQWRYYSVYIAPCPPNDSIIQFIFPTPTPTFLCASLTRVGF